ncbi:MAG: CehA/McbA family metallohydrolase [candidate division KSB1 bacterium]|nr:CehA/McbA family metallohydrolase [candidate division KSB1 bacterium]
MILLEHIPDFFLFVIAIAYAEIHYRIGILPSRYFIKEPEIIADVPNRLQKGPLLPVAVVVKDSDKYPVKIQQITCRITQPYPFSCILPIDQVLERHFWAICPDVQLPDEMTGCLSVDIIIDYEYRGKQKRCINDNYKLLSHRPFSVFVDPEPLPCEKGWALGDLHTHSHLSRDQVEFGAPPHISRKMAKAMGLSYFAVTDHSYDLDDSPHNYLVNDPSLPKWNELWNTVSELNSQDEHFVIIPGEEVSAGNCKSRNVHCLILNNPDFIPGSGDSAEKWLHTRPEHSITYCLSRKQSSAAVIAAHPFVPIPFLQKMLVRRDKWRKQDVMHEHLDGLQLWNGDDEYFMATGIQEWIQLLLQGRQIGLFAGTDAHGNFNRFRQIGLPHFSMKESEKEVFGRAHTGLYIDQELSVGRIIKAIQRQHAFVSNGPFAWLDFRANGKRFMVGDRCTKRSGEIQINCKTTKSFGVLKAAVLIIGDCALQQEVNRPLKVTQACYRKRVSLDIANLPEKGYLRLKVVTDKNCVAYTNPIYLT